MVSSFTVSCKNKAPIIHSDEYDIQFSQITVAEWTKNRTYFLICIDYANPKIIRYITLEHFDSKNATFHVTKIDYKLYKQHNAYDFFVPVDCVNVNSIFLPDIVAYIHDSIRDLPPPPKKKFTSCFIKRQHPYKNISNYIFMNTIMSVTHH